METNGCDFSPLRTELKVLLTRISDSLDRIREKLDQEEVCLLNEIERLTEAFTESETLASTYYLNCFLAPYTNSYKEISRALHRLSAKRQGALVVIQRKEPLGDWLTPGIPLSADITSSLLESIFVPGSPLHDGAVLIRQDRILSAANVLPLTERTYGSRKLGTRHRAAVGLSERTDALVLVVSEETGHTSFCMGGTLYPFRIPYEAVANDQHRLN